MNAMSKVIALPLWAHASLSVLSVLWFGWTKGKLDASYGASGHPVDYVTGQTTFDGATIKGFYAAMSKKGTLDVYVTTQMIDFAFILGFVAIGLFVCSLIARVCRADSLGRKLGLFAAISIILGALSDVIENGWSFVMLTDPNGFADWLAIPYSLFAVVKFGLIALGLGLVFASLFLAVIGRVLRKPALG